jgi:hypothetical protein
MVGVLLFLYGANYFEATVGWTGVFLVVAGIVVEIVVKLYEAFGKRGKRGLEAVEL